MSQTLPPFPESAIQAAQQEFHTLLEKCATNVWLDFYKRWDNTPEHSKKTQRDIYALEKVVDEMDEKIEKLTSQFQNTHKQLIVDTWNNFSETVQQLISDKMFNKSEKIANSRKEHVWQAMLKNLLTSRNNTAIRVQNRINSLIEETPWPMNKLLDDEKPGYWHERNKIRAGRSSASAHEVLRAELDKLKLDETSNPYFVSTQCLFK